MKIRPQNHESRKKIQLCVKIFTVLLTIVSWLFSLPSYATSIKSGPWLQAVTDKSAVIMWESSEKKPGGVFYGTSSSNLSHSKIAQYTDVPPRDNTDVQVIIQEAKITGLTANTT
ncbi:MAG: fibronectin type III domain-containing protein, partial [Acidobacteriota bacterium]